MTNQEAWKLVRKVLTNVLKRVMFFDKDKGIKLNDAIKTLDKVFKGEA